jgi:hypothetical protein
MTRKIESVAQKYNLETRLGQEIDDELVDRWKGDGRVEMGYRRVADWLNMEIIRSAYEDAGLTLIDKRIEADYEVLEGDDEVEKRSLVDELEKQGVDAKDIMNDFVGDTTVYRYLTEELEVEKQKEAEDSRDWSFDTIEDQIDGFGIDLRRALLRLTRKIS